MEYGNYIGKIYCKINFTKETTYECNYLQLC